MSRSAMKLLKLCLVGMVLLFATGQCFATTYATWLMVWYGHDQKWWKDGKPDGSKTLVDGQWKTLDWADESQYSAYLDGVKKAGVTVVVADLTNGWGWLNKRSQVIQALCAKKGLKFCVAENSSGDTAKFERHAQDIWEKFAGPDAPNHEAYFNYHGKPLIVCYAIRKWFNSYTSSETPFRSKFNLVWSSGEDTNIDKWGWQLEPWTGSIPSKDSMFVTSSVKWGSKSSNMWRKSLTWLDYNFALAKKNNPEYIVVGSYDDPGERNAWFVSDTSDCEPGRQMRDKGGYVNSTAYYERVKEWISGKPSIVKGGLLRDGAYSIVNRANGKYLGVLGTERTQQGTPEAALGARDKVEGTFGLFWFYHLGKNQYRVIALQSGLALEAPAAVGGELSKLIQNWDSSDPRQRWALTRTRDGYFRLKNNGTGKVLTLSGEETADSPATLDYYNAKTNQQWKMGPVLTL